MNQQQAEDNPVLLQLLSVAKPLVAEGRYSELDKVLAGIGVPADHKAHTLCELSYGESLKGRYRNAHAAAAMACRVDFRDPRIAMELASRLRTFNEPGLLESLAKRFGPPSRMPVPLLLAFAAQFSHLGCQEKAWIYLEECQRADPDYPPTALAVGQVLTYRGKLDEADRAFERCIRRAPEIAQAHWFLAGLSKQTPTRNHIQRLLALANGQGSKPVVGNDLLQFALHKEFADLGETESAWTHLERGCRIKRDSLDYATAQSEALFDALISAPTLASPSVRNDSDVTPGPTPLFIIGMHRSGTTLLEQMLDGHPAVLGVGELYDFTSAMRYATDHHCQGVIDLDIVRKASVPGFDFSQAGSRYLAGMAWRLEGKSVFTDKLPSNFLNAGFICQALPQAKLLHMVRDPVEVCFSNLRELFSSANPYSYDQVELADFYLLYRRLMTHWREAFPGRILDIHYDRLVRDPESVVREICDFCGLQFDPEMLAIGNRKRGVATASAVQVREGIQVRDVPKWKPYEAYLQPLIRRLRAGGVLD